MLKRKEAGAVLYQYGQLGFFMPFSQLETPDASNIKEGVGIDGGKPLAVRDWARLQGAGFLTSSKIFLRI